MTPLFLAALLAAKPAPAKKLPPLPKDAMVFVLKTDGSQPAEAAGLEAKLLKALREKAVLLTDLDAAFPQPTPPNGGEALFKEGKDAYDNLDLDTAKAKFGEALVKYGQEPTGASAERIAETQIYLAAITSQAGGKSAAKQLQSQLASALVMKPDFSPDTKLFGPDLPKLLEKAHADVNGRPKASLHVDVTPHGSEVTFRDQALVAPVEPIADLPTGYHYVSAKRPGFEPAAAVAEVGPAGATVTLELKPSAALAETQASAGALIAAFPAKALPPAARTFGDKHKCRYLVLANAETGSVQVWDVEGGGRLRDLKLSDSPEVIAAVAEKVKTFIDKPSPVEVDVRKEEPVASDSVLTKWWFWAAVGGGAAVVAGTTAGVAAASSGPKRPFSPVLGF